MSGPEVVTVHDSDDVSVVTVSVPDEIAVVTVEVPGVIGPKGEAGGIGPAGPANTLTVGSVNTLAAGSNASVSISGASPNQVLSFAIPQGLQGIQGVKGDTGATGATGATGPANTLAVGTTTTGAAGSNAAATITGTAPNQTLNLTIPRGNTGLTGPANTLAIGTVTTLAAGTSATASITGTAPNQTLNLSIPQGTKGDTGLTGPANTLAVGTVTTGAAGSSATATITGAAPNQTLNLTIPAGPQGPAGAGSPDATTTTSGAITLSGDLGGTASAPTVISGTHHTHTSSQISDASSSTANNTLVLRNAVGEARIGRLYTENTTPSTTDEYTAKAYVDGQVATKVSVAGDIGGTAAAPTVIGGTHHSHTSSQISDAVSAATANMVVRRDANGRASVADPSASTDISTKNYVDTQVGTKAAIAGDLGGTAAAPTVTGGTHHTHTSSQISDAASVATANVLIKRDANGRAQVADPSVAADIATKNYVDTKVPTVSDSSTSTKGVVQLAGDLGGTAAAPTVVGGTHHTHTSSQISDAASAATASAIVLRDTNASANFNEVILSGQSTTASATRKDYVDGKTWPSTAINDATSVATASKVIIRDANGRASVADPSASTDIATKNYVDSKATGSGNVLVLGQSDSVPAGTPANTVIVRPGAPYTDEQVRDVMGVALTAGTGTSIVVDDPNDKITIGLSSAYTKATASGIASLDANGYVPASQLGNVPAPAAYVSPITTLYKSATTSRTSTVTKTLDPDLATTLAVGSYIIESELRWFGEGSTTNNYSFNWGGTATLASTATNMTYVSAAYNGTAYLSSGAMDPTASIFSTSQTGSPGWWYRINLYVVVTASGTYGVQWSQNSTSSTVTALGFGSFMRATKVA